MVKDSLYLLVGKEEFLKREFIQGLRKKIFASSQDPTFQEFHPTEHSFSALEEFLKTGTLFGGKKMAVLWEVDDLEAEEKERLLSLCPIFSSDLTLVVSSQQGSAKKDIFLSRLAAAGRLLSFHVPFEKDFPSWIEGRARKRGCLMDEASEFFLLQQVGRDTSLLDSAIERLSIYIHPKNTITLSDAQALLGRSAQADVFALTEVLMNKNAKAALQIIEGLLKHGQRGFEIMAVLVSQLERLKKAARLMKRGVAAEAIGSQLKIHPYYLGKTLDQARHVPWARMRDIFGALLSCDEAIKTGRLNDGLALQELVLTLCAA